MGVRKICVMSLKTDGEPDERPKELENIRNVALLQTIPPCSAKECQSFGAGRSRPHQGDVAPVTLGGPYSTSRRLPCWDEHKAADLQMSDLIPQRYEPLGARSRTSGRFPYARAANLKTPEAAYAGSGNRRILSSPNLKASWEEIVDIPAGGTRGAGISFRRSLR